MKEKNHLIAPSLLAADFSKLGEEVKMINESRADWLHLDIMDGRFVPNISYGMMIVECMAGLTDKPLDVHLMIVEPEKYIEEFARAGASVITVHAETCPHLHRSIQQIKDAGAKAGVALNPSTPVHVLEDVLEDIDMALIMSVNPGFGGQKFIYRTIPKIKALSQMITERNLDTAIEVDGGVGLQNAGAILEAGANVLVAGNSIFKSENPIETIERFKQIGAWNGSPKI